MKYVQQVILRKWFIYQVNKTYSRNFIRQDLLDMHKDKSSEISQLILHWFQFFPNKKNLLRNSCWTPQNGRMTSVWRYRSIIIYKNILTSHPLHDRVTWLSRFIWSLFDPDVKLISRRWAICLFQINYKLVIDFVEHAPFLGQTEYAETLSV